MDIRPGQRLPLAPTVSSDRVNFCVFSKNCGALELLLFDDNDEDIAPMGSLLGFIVMMPLGVAPG